MILSNQDGNVSWKLNDLIHASRRASYRRYESLEHADKEQEFLPWTPTMLKLIDDQIVEANIEEEQNEPSSDSLDEKECLEPVVEEKLVSEEKMIAEVQESYQKGYDEGKAVIESELSDKLNKLEQFIDGFTNAQENLEDFHSPLVKLSLAIANQLVRAEIRLDAAVINELVRQSLSAIESTSEDTVVVYLAEEDLEHANNILAETFPNVKFEIDNELSSGSLRVVMDDTAIEDLIENRLNALSDQLFQPQQESNLGHQQIIDPATNSDGETLVSPEEKESGFADTMISKPITSAENENDLEVENSINEPSSPTEIEEPEMLSITTEDEDKKSATTFEEVDTEDTKG